MEKPSEWGELEKTIHALCDALDEGLADRILLHTSTFLHHNTEDIIEQCAKEAEEWLDDTEADETVKAILRVVAKQIRALKPTHKE